ncbi:MAG: carboxypeptidase-like regulatory domain-containing protein [Terracidiphilus sp.]
MPLDCRAQDAPETPQVQNQNPAPSTPTATLHGIVINVATGEPVPRALVRILDQEGTGALTDGQGRFEIAGLATGPQPIGVRKPGFLDEMADAAARGQSNDPEFAHTVWVSADMPDVVVRMTPANSIRGQVQLSTGEAAQGIEITLLKQTIETGRTIWQMAGNARTNADGMFRFGGLADGSYALYSAPAMESDTFPGLVEPGNARAAERSGYPSLFFPDAHDLAGAAKMQLQGGTQTEANLSLTLEPFHAVTASVLFPGGAGRNESSGEPEVGRFLAAFSGEGQMPYMAQATVTDGQGHQLSYVANYDQATQSVQAFLPDGNYMFTVTASRPVIMRAGTGDRFQGVPQEDDRIMGALEFAVAGHPVTNLRVPLTKAPRSQVQVNLTRTATNTGTDSSGDVRTASTSGLTTLGADSVFLTVSQAGGWIGDGMINSYASGTLTGPLNTTFAQPGTYWVHATLSGGRLCESSVTAGGANLAREPLVLGFAGPAAPVTLNLRDDCARLTLTLPANAAQMAGGEEPFYTVYVVPDFDTTEDVVPQTLRPSSGGKITLEGLTPGSYHVYAFDKPVALAYRERGVLEALPNPGQSVELSPASSVNLMLEIANPR